MKTQKNTQKEMKLIFKYIILTSLFIMVASGCTKSTSNKDTVANTTTTIPVITDPDLPTVEGCSGVQGAFSYTSGSTVDFKPTSLQVFSNQQNGYITRPLNDPSNFKINVNLSSPGAGVYGGEVSISYVDNCIQYEGLFKAGLGKNPTYTGMYDNGSWQSEFNFWFNFDNKKVFSGMYEDEFGAIAIVLEPMDPGTGGNDAEPVNAGPYKGSIFFKNFVDQDGKPVYGGHSPYRACWHTYRGPYDCRSNVVMTKCHLNPGADSGYRLLGTFENIDIKKAFNIN